MEFDVGEFFEYPVYMVVLQPFLIIGLLQGRLDRGEIWAICEQHPIVGVVFGSGNARQLWSGLADSRTKIGSELDGCSLCFGPYLPGMIKDLLQMGASLYLEYRLFRLSMGVVAATATGRWQ